MVDTRAALQRASKATADSGSAAAAAARPPPAAAHMASATQPAPERPPHAAAAAALSSRVVLPSQRTALALLLLPPLVYLLAVLLGLSHHTGVVLHGKHVVHFMRAFEKRLFRPYGSLLPFGVLALRVAATRLCLPYGRPAAGSPAALLPCAVRATLVRGTMVVYCLIAAVRLLLYVVHVGVQIRYDAYILSDHLFLGGAVVACLHSEVVCCTSDLHKLWLQRAAQGWVRRMLVAVVLVCTCMLSLATSADMYFTGRHFHWVSESLTALVVGMLLFQVPLGMWLRARCMFVDSV